MGNQNGRNVGATETERQREAATDRGRTANVTAKAHERSSEAPQNRHNSKSNHHGDAAFHHETAAHHHREAAKHHAAKNHGDAKRHADAAHAHGAAAHEHADRARDHEWQSSTNSDDASLPSPERKASGGYDDQASDGDAGGGRENHLRSPDPNERDDDPADPRESSQGSPQNGATSTPRRTLDRRWGDTDSPDRG